MGCGRISLNFGSNYLGTSFHIRPKCRRLQPQAMSTSRALARIQQLCTSIPSLQQSALSTQHCSNAILYNGVLLPTLITAAYATGKRFLFECCRLHIFRTSIQTMAADEEPPFLPPLTTGAMGAEQTKTSRKQPSRSHSSAIGRVSGIFGM